MLKNDYLVAKIGLDTAENGPFERPRGERRAQGVGQAPRLAPGMGQAHEPVRHLGEEGPALGRRPDLWYQLFWGQATEWGTDF